MNPMLCKEMVFGMREGFDFVFFHVGISALHKRRGYMMKYVLDLNSHWLCRGSTVCIYI